jgi:hypothetical protein
MDEPEESNQTAIKNFNMPIGVNLGIETDRAKLARNSGISTNFLAQRKKMTHT